MPDRVALVTGASRGIGLAVARRLAETGHDLVVHGHRADVIADAAAQLADKYGVRVLHAHGDIADPATSRALMRVAFENYRRLPRHRPGRGAAAG